MKRCIRAGLAGLSVAVVAAPAAHGADVTVRAEAFAGTVLTQTAVAETGPDALANGMSCPDPETTGERVAGALERATGGDWDGSSFSFGLTVERILTTDLGGFPSPTFWSFDLDNVSQFAGVCDVDPQPGDEILFYEACGETGETECFTGTPLDLIAPEEVVSGEPFTVTVLQYDESNGAASPAAAATVAGGGVSATTDDAGHARLTLTETGPLRLTATKDRQVRDSVPVVVLPPYAIVTPTPTAAPDRTAPVTRVRGIREGRRFAKGPRSLRARVAEANGIELVQLSLTRKRRGRCAAFRGDSERFGKVRCGRHPRFGVGVDPEVSFLLPSRLGPGRYVLTVTATDAAGNRERVKRGRNRVRFVVR